MRIDSRNISFAVLPATQALGVGCGLDDPAAPGVTVLGD